MSPVREPDLYLFATLNACMHHSYLSRMPSAVIVPPHFMSNIESMIDDTESEYNNITRTLISL
jgi:hypothetical protein